MEGAMNRGGQLLTIEQVRSRLGDRGITLESKSYNGINEPLMCRCTRCLNLWRTCLRHVNHGHGCPVCWRNRLAESKRTPEEAIIRRLQSLGLVAIEIFYVRRGTCIRFQCQRCDYDGISRWNHLRKRGCTACGIRRGKTAKIIPLVSVRSRLRELGIVLLANEYHGCRVPLRVRFPCGCEGNRSFNALMNGAGCSSCSTHKRVSLSDYERMAELHGGRVQLGRASKKRIERRGHWVSCLGVRSQRESCRRGPSGGADGYRMIRCNRRFHFGPGCG